MNLGQNVTTGTIHTSNATPALIVPLFDPASLIDPSFLVGSPLGLPAGTRVEVFGITFAIQTGTQEDRSIRGRAVMRLVGANPAVWTFSGGEFIGSPTGIGNGTVLAGTISTLIVNVPNGANANRPFVTIQVTGIAATQIDWGTILEVDIFTP